MNDQCFQLAEKLVPPTYIRQAQQARRARESLLKSLLAQRRELSAGGQSSKAPANRDATLECNGIIVQWFDGKAKISK